MTEVNEVQFSRGGKMAEGEGGLGRLIKMVVIALVLLLIVGVGGWLAYTFLLSGEQETAGTAGKPAALRTDSGFIAEPHYLDLETFVVNLADGRRYLKAKLQLLLNEEEAKNYLAVRMAEVKDVVISELQTLNSEQLRDPKERELLKQRLLRKVESLLPTKEASWSDLRPIKKVLITEFYLQ